MAQPGWALGEVPGRCGCGAPILPGVASEFFPQPGEGLLVGVEFLLKLQIADPGEQPAHFGPRCNPLIHQVPSCDEWRKQGGLLLHLELLLDEIIVNSQTAMGTEAVQPVQLQFQGEGRFQKHPAEG